MVVFKLTKLSNQAHALLHIHVSVQAQKWNTFLFEHELDDVEYLLGLAEEQKFV